MQICDISHDEIVYNAGSCPFCDYIDEKTAEITSLSQEVEDLNQRIEILEQDLVDADDREVKSNVKEGEKE